MSTIQYATLLTIGVGNLAATGALIKVMLRIRGDALETREEARTEIDTIREEVNEFTGKLGSALSSIKL